MEHETEARYLVALGVVRLDAHQLVAVAAERVHALLQALRTKNAGLLRARVLPDTVGHDALRHSGVGDPDTTRLHRHSSQTTLEQGPYGMSQNSQAILGLPRTSHYVIRSDNADVTVRSSSLISWFRSSPPLETHPTFAVTPTWQHRR